MERAADHSPLADLALALAEIDALSIAGLSRNHNTPVESELLALRAAVSRASVSLKKIEFWLLPSARVAPESSRRTIVSHQKSLMFRFISTPRGP